MTVASVFGPGRVYAQKAGTLKIASVVSLSGNFASYGDHLKRGADIAVERINAAGGVRVGDTTFKVEIEHYDDKTDATTAARLVERAVTTEKAHMVLAPLGSVLVKACIPVAQRLRFPMMAYWAHVDSVFAPQKGDPWLFCALNAFSGFYTLIMEMATKFDNPKIGKVAIISPNDELGVSAIKEYFPNDLKRARLQLAAAELYPAKTQEYVGALERIRRTNPDGIVINAYTPDIIAIFKEMQMTKLFPPLLVVEAPTKLYEALGPAINGAFVPLMWHESLTGTKAPYIGSNKEFARIYKDKHKEDVTDFVAPLGAHSVLAYVQVLQKAGVVDDPAKTRKAFLEFQGETFFSKVSFNDIGLNPQHVIYPGQWHDGKIELVYPPQLATAKPMHPFPLWKKA
ncbi:MAG: ABC transporter substrate-binding protein [Gemmatimonadales bacterium]